MARKRIDLNGMAGDDFTFATVFQALHDADDVLVHINSGGGDPIAATTIYTALAKHEGRVDVVIQGIAAGSASVIAMAGQTVTIADGAVFMVSDPWAYTHGKVDDQTGAIKELEALATVHSQIFAKRAGISEARARQLMKAQTWYDGEAAKRAGFVTATGLPRSKSSGVRRASVEEVRDSWRATMAKMHLVPAADATAVANERPAATAAAASWRAAQAKLDRLRGW